jgi:hypothetical protein
VKTIHHDALTLFTRLGNPTVVIRIAKSYIPFKRISRPCYILKLGIDRADTSGIDHRLLGSYRVLKICSGKMEDKGKVISSTVDPKQLTVSLYRNSVKIFSRKPVEFKNLGEKMIDNDPSGRILHFLCPSTGPGLMMIALREYKDRPEITLGVINMVDFTYTDYELISIRKDAAVKL